MIFAWPRFYENRDKFVLGVYTTPGPNGQQELVNPRFTGIDHRNRPYVVTASQAHPRGNSPQLIALTSPNADMTTDTGSWVALSAESGLLNRGKEELELSGTVNLFHDAGHEIKTKSARVFLKKGIATGREKVNGQGPLGTIQSSGFMILDKGQTLVFSGQARLTLYPAIKR